MTKGTYRSNFIRPNLPNFEKKPKCANKPHLVRESKEISRRYIFYVYEVLFFNCYKQKFKISWNFGKLLLHI